jgi:hypothetical protein
MMDQRDVPRRVAVGLASVAVAMLFALVIPSVPASAGTPLSSIVISNALPGLVAAPPGPFNGPLTSETLDSYFGGNSGTSSAFRQAITDGNVTAYIRMWRNDPPNGAFVGIIAAQLPNSTDAAAAMEGGDQSANGNQFGHFSVPEVPHAVGVTLVTNSPEGVVNEEMVMFAKGVTLFDVVTGQVTNASNSGAPQLDESDAIQIAQHQDARAPGEAVAPCNCGSENVAYEVGRYFGIALPVGAVIGLVVYLIRRSRRSLDPQTAFWSAPSNGGGSFGAWGPAPPFPPPVGHGIAPSATNVGTALLERPRPTIQPDFHCAWCGSGISLGSGAHECGSRDRPASYCMKCGSLFADRSTTCESCGTPKLQ